MSNYFVNWLSACGAVTACIFVTAPAHTHTHTHTFNGPLSRTTRVNRYQKGKTYLDFTEARDSEWQWHQLGHMQVCTSIQRDSHASTSPLGFFTGWMPFLPPSQQRQSTEGRISLMACMSINLCTLECDYSMYVDYCIARLYLSVMFAER